MDMAGMGGAAVVSAMREVKAAVKVKGTGDGIR